MYANCQSLPCSCDVITGKVYYRAKLQDTKVTVFPRSNYIAGVKGDKKLIIEVSIIGKICWNVFDLDVRTKISFKLPQDCMSKYLKECVAKHY